MGYFNQLGFMVLSPNGINVCWGHPNFLQFFEAEFSLQVTRNVLLQLARYYGTIAQWRKYIFAGDRGHRFHTCEKMGNWEHLGEM